MESWHPRAAKSLAESLIGDLGDRWAHVSAVGRRAEMLCSPHRSLSDGVSAAWLHDVGYAPGLVDSGLHPLDGARFLAREGAPSQIVSLVAYHSGAEYEADERGLARELAAFARPAQDDLDVLILVDMTTSPTGVPVTVDERLAEILRRYEPADPVHRAVTRSSGYLRECAARAGARLGLPDEGSAVPL